MSGEAERSDDEIRADLAVIARVQHPMNQPSIVMLLAADVPSLLARAVAAEAREAQLRAEADEAYSIGVEQVRRRCVHAEAELAAAQADVRRVGVASGWRDTLPCCRNAYDHALHVLAAASGVAPGPGQPGKSDGDGAGLTGHRGFESPSTPGIAPGNPNAWPTL